MQLLVDCAAHDATVTVDAELLDWADVIFVMERAQRTRLQKRFRAHLGGKRLVCLDIADDYAFMETSLVERLLATVPKHLPVGHP